MKVMPVRILPAALFFAALAFGGVAAEAQTPITAACKDGSSQSGTSRRAACKGHGGVQPVKATTEAAPATPAPAAPVEQTAPVSPAAKAPRQAAAPTVARTPTNPGDVWVNTATKIYHCPTDKAYGKTKVGSFMTEAEAKAAGDRASHNKACTAAPAAR